jgi:hypothetical protein
MAAVAMAAVAMAAVIDSGVWGSINQGTSNFVNLWWRRAVARRVASIKPGKLIRFFLTFNHSASILTILLFCP